jgi:hypothetical protein
MSVLLHRLRVVLLSAALAAASVATAALPAQSAPTGSGGGAWEAAATRADIGPAAPSAAPGGASPTPRPVAWRGPWTVESGTYVDRHGLAAEGNVLHVVYRRAADDGERRLVYRRSVDGGRHWAPEQVLWQTAAPSRLLGEPAVAAWVVWSWWCSAPTTPRRRGS